jgi:hypothetical protein
MTKLITERDAVRADASIDWRIVRKIARDRALAERDIDILVAAYGGPILKPSNVGFHNVIEWRRELALRVDLTNLKLTPFRKLYRETLKNAWSAARAVQTVRVAEIARNRMVAERASPTRLALMDMLLGSAKVIEAERVS